MRSNRPTSNVKEGEDNLEATERTKTQNIPNSKVGDTQYIQTESSYREMGRSMNFSIGTWSRVWSFWHESVAISHQEGNKPCERENIQKGAACAKGLSIISKKQQ
jgi:hypothetical protein